MIKEMDNPGEPITEERLVDIERELDAKLPMQYRQFLLKFNGGMPSPDIVDIQGFPESPTDVQEFLSVGTLDESSDLIWNKRTFADRIQDHLLPVARDSGGSLFCLSLSGKDAGEVIYADLRFVGDMKQNVTYYNVAESFETFIGKIREWEEP